MKSGPVVFGLCLVQAAATSFEEHKLRDGLQVWQSSRKGRDIIWGRCNGWFHKLKSCILPPDTPCTAHLSNGPADADVEVRLGNLPVFENHPTFVQWWTARKSEQSYDPLSHPEEATIYDDMFQAYPRYYDPDFNGGNVKVDANGEAVITFRAPATHRIGKDVRVPHVHIRICASGQKFSLILGRRDKVQLTSNGPLAKSECNTAENKLHIISFRPLRTPPVQGLVQRGMSLASHAWEQMDLDALEFSPVFQCLSSQLLYDHIEGDCAESCPDGSVLTHGQCVKPASSMQSFSAMWDLHVCGCDERCWADKKEKTMHRLRLEIAEHMDIALHEVHELDISFIAGSYPGEAPVARMRIHIRSPRHTLETGTSMLRSLFYNTQRSSEVLAMFVLNSKEMSAQDLGFLHKRIVASSEDVYLPYYQDLEIVKRSSAPDGTPNVSKLESTVGADEGVTASLPMVMLSICCVGMAALVLKCALAQHVKMREPNLRGLGEPLTSPEDPPLFPGCPLTRFAMQPEQSRSNEQQSMIEQYLVTVYARAVC